MAEATEQNEHDESYANNQIVMGIVASVVAKLNGNVVNLRLLVIAIDVVDDGSHLLRERFQFGYLCKNLANGLVATLS